MSLQLAAQHLAAQGRGPDKNLVHMSPREVAGLQALAKAGGGSLSINPQTGLPEAGFLENMLPMLIGVGITAATGGAAAPWMVGLGLGGFEAARTGNLSKGLMAGLGAYGGAGLAGGLMAAGAGTAGAAGTAAGTAGAGTAANIAQVAPQAAGATTPGIDVAYDMLGVEPYLDQAAGIVPQGAPVTVGGSMANQSLLAQPTYTPPTVNFGSGAGSMDANLGEAAARQAMTFNPSQIPAGGGADMYADAAGAYTPMPEPVDAVSRLSPGDMALRQQPTPTFGSRLSQMGKGLKGLTTDEGRGAFMSEVGKGKGLMKYGAAAGLPLLMTEPKPLNVPGSGPNPYQYRFDPGRTEEGYVDPVTGQRRYFNPTYTRLAAGGPVEEMSAANVYDMQNARGGVSDLGVDNSTGMQRMADGGISHLGDYSDGGRLLKGPGDGVSDSIPAMIGNKQPARLADGEFVVPARIVSELGNGSTEAGARKLYAMMDRIQKARRKTTGKNRVAANTRSDKYLPA